MIDIQGKKTLNHIRRKIIDSCYTAKNGHIASSFSVVEAVHGLYNFYAGDIDKFYFLLSKGHAAPCFYSVLNDFDIITDKEFSSFCKFKSSLTAHVSHYVPGVIVSSGALGMGLSIGIGICLANKIEGNRKKVFVLLGDGELNEGSVWESLIYCGGKKIKNIVCLIDNNKLQASKRTSDIIDSELLFSGIKSLGWELVRVDGHDLDEINKMYLYAASCSHPLAVVLDTVKGKGVSFMENDINWHHRQISDEEYLIALNELAL